jgi:dihydroorotate dehydrogenase electron transfer subunit
MSQIRAQVLASSEVIAEACLLWALAAEIAASSQPGQFVMVRCAEGYDLLLRRPLSIHRVSEDGSKLALLFAVVGRGTRWLSQRKQGEGIDLLGPLGRGFVIEPGSRNLLLLAGGIGIAPLILLAEKALAAGCSVRLALGADTGSQIYPRHLLPQGMELVIVTADGSMGERGLVTDLLPRFIDWADQIFACGPIPMYRNMASMYGQLLAPKSVQVLLEQMMGCGLGACRGCAIETRQGHKLVCKDGPVFELSDVIWDQIKEPVLKRRDIC